MIDWLSRAYSRVQAALARPGVRISLQVIVISLSLLFLADHGEATIALMKEGRIRTIFLVSALGVSILSGFLGTITWWNLMGTFGKSTPWLISSRIHLTSNLAKYIPGSVWQLGGKFLLTRNTGVSKKGTIRAMVVEVLLLVFIGLALAIIFFPTYLGSLTTISTFQRLFFPFLGFIILGLLYGSSKFISRQNEDLSPNQDRPSSRGMTLTVLLFLIGWVLLGFSFWLVGRSVLSLELNSFPLFTFTLATSFLIGFVVIFLPGGIGLRETLMVVLLKGTFSPAESVLIAGLSRFVLTLADFLTYALFMLFIWLKTKFGQ
jgi:uncharacterized membrane protein YbhN (UPF0104 family)